MSIGEIKQACYNILADVTMALDTLQNEVFRLDGMVSEVNGLLDHGPICLQSEPWYGASILFHETYLPAANAALDHFRTEIGKL